MPAKNTAAARTAGKKKPAKKKPAPQPTQVKLSVINGDLVANPDPAPVAPGGTIDWDFGGPWAVEFIDAKSKSKKKYGPFADNKRGRRRGDGKPRNVKKHTKKTRYGYTVAVYDATTRRVYMKDPEVIVDPKRGSLGGT